MDKAGKFTTDEHGFLLIDTDKIGEYQISAVVICGKNRFFITRA